MCNMTKLIHLLIVVPFFFSCGNTQSGRHPTGSDKLGLDTTGNTFLITSEDTSMNLAIAKAKLTIDKFDQALKSNNSSYSDFAVKKRYMTSDNGGEHMWITGIILVNGNYKGFINNDAEKTTEVKYGDTVIVRKDEITDWMYLDKNVLRGGYTIREIRNKLNKAEKVKMDKDMGFKIED
jgi:uncharacterized protein YegJ (DUF2314 family)